MSQSQDLPTVPGHGTMEPRGSRGPPAHGSGQLNIGIVGGGIAGLYAGLLLQREGHSVHIYEGSNRVGGRVHTHFFSTAPNQYFEAGAMRIPDSNFHKVTFDLIDYLQSFECIREVSSRAVELMEYKLQSEGNDLYINGHHLPQTKAISITARSVNWPDIPQDYADQSVEALMKRAIQPFIDRLQNDFDNEFKDIVAKYDTFSFRRWLKDVMDYPTSVIDFLETTISQTNQFSLSVTELLMQNMDFDEEKWKMIKNGMSRLPDAMAYIFGQHNISYGARVTGLRETAEGIVVRTESISGSLRAIFDHVILAIPPAALKMIVDRPEWSIQKDVAIRSMHFEALYKMGIRFKRRFWEDPKISPGRPSEGGQSTTDLPIRWIVFPSYGIGEDEPGVLLVYAWMTDATTWLPLTPLERQKLALDCIDRMYRDRIGGDGKPINVYELFMESADAVWEMSTATGDAMFLPGQFESRFEQARVPESGGRIHFAGEHLSYHHTWITGACESALYAVRTILDSPKLPPLRCGDKPMMLGEADAHLSSSNVERTSPSTDFPFAFRTKGLGTRAAPFALDAAEEKVVLSSIHLEGDDKHPLGAQITVLGGL